MSQSLRLARQQGKVEDLAARFGVTLQTIRRDLADLASAGQLQRVHGGAVLPSGTVNLAHEDRRALHREAKAAMARACAAMIPHKASVAINIGTSTEAVARELLHHSALLVADQSKFQRAAPARIATLAEVDTLLTDRAPAAPLAEVCAGWDTAIRVCS